MKLMIRSLLSFAILVVSQTALASTDLVVSKSSASNFLSSETTIVGQELKIDKVIKCSSMDENLVEAVLESVEGVRLVVEDVIKCVEIVRRVNSGSVSVVILEDQGSETENEETEKGCRQVIGRWVEAGVVGLSTTANLIQSILVSSANIVSDSYCR